MVYGLGFRIEPNTMRTNTLQISIQHHRTNSNRFEANQIVDVFAKYGLQMFSVVHFASLTLLADRSVVVLLSPFPNFF